MIFKILPDLSGKSSQRLSSKKISHKQVVSLTQQSAHTLWIFTPKRYLFLWAKPGLLLESPVISYYFCFRVFHFLGFFLMHCSCRCNQMLQLLVPVHFWAWLNHTALCAEILLVAASQRPDSHLNWGLIPFYTPIKQQRKKALAENRTGP